jgi:hypothetical protein
MRRVRDLGCGEMRIFLEIDVRRVACRRCTAVKRERLDFLAENPRYTKRFAFYVGKRCRAASIKDIAEELVLDLRTANCSERQYRGERPTSRSESGRWVPQLFVLRLDSLLRMKARMSSRGSIAGPVDRRGSATSTCR